MTSEETGRKQRRGIRFPMHSMREAVRMAQAVQEQGGGKLDVDTLATAIGMSVKGSSFQTRVSSAVHFGLLDRDGGRVEVTDLAKRIVRPLSEDERLTALKDALFHFDVFSEIYQRYSGGKLPAKAVLENILTREYGVSDASTAQACDVFIDSLRFAELAHDAEDDSIVCGNENFKNASQPPTSSSIATKKQSAMLDTKVVKLLKNAGALTILSDVGDIINPDAEEKVAAKYLQLVDESLSLSSDLMFVGTKLSLKIMKDKISTEGHRAASGYVQYLEHGLAEDLGIGD